MANRLYTPPSRALQALLAQKGAGDTNQLLGGEWFGGLGVAGC